MYLFLKLAELQPAVLIMGNICNTGGKILKKPTILPFFIQVVLLYLLAGFILFFKCLVTKGLMILCWLYVALISVQYTFEVLWPVGVRASPYVVEWDRLRCCQCVHPSLTSEAVQGQFIQTLGSKVPWGLLNHPEHLARAGCHTASVSLLVVPETVMWCSSLGSPS